MDPQLKKGILDALVLSILEEGDTYGYQLSERVARILELSETALYPVLRRLEAQGWLGTYAVEHNGRLRKYYHLTVAGQKRLRQYVEELTELERIIRIIAKGAGNHGEQN
ncbi:MAG TPA: PadR family transcriptional regulator [Firmicutes bacterium]|jgi:PadR family transcriptional regulator PadR|nr:PadR family transcriptional regulator [Bacillota bacterium]